MTTSRHVCHFVVPSIRPSAPQLYLYINDSHLHRYCAATCHLGRRVPQRVGYYVLYTDTVACNAMSRDLAQGAHILLDWVATKTRSSAHIRLDTGGVQVDSCAGALLVLEYRVIS